MPSELPTSEEREDIALEGNPQLAVRYRQLVELSPEAIFVCQNQKLVLCNRAATTLLEASDASELLGRCILDFVHVDYHAMFREHRHPPAHDSVSASFVEQTWFRFDGSAFHVEIGITALTHNDAPAIQAVVRDITERKRLEALQLGQNRILNMIATGAALPDILNELALFAERQSSGSVCSILRLDSEGTRFVECTAPSLPSAYFGHLQMPGAGPRNGACGTSVFRAEPVMVTNIETDPLWFGRRKFVLDQGLKACTSWPIFGTDKKVLGAFTLYFQESRQPDDAELQLFSACTNLAAIAIESRASEQRIRYLAHYDGLTSLPNRFLFKEYLDLALRNAQRHENRFAVLFLDLDKFKQINDTMGHDAGDLVLQETAQRLRSCLRDTDKIARMGGDEFYVLIEELHDGRHAADVAQKLLKEACRPVHIDGKECSLSVSIGISVYPEDGITAQTLIKNADTAMYRSKENGKNTYRFYSAFVDYGSENTVIARRSHLVRHPDKTATRNATSVRNRPTRFLA